jgi:cytochrome c oxidase assembly protein subunit 11
MTPPETTPPDLGARNRRIGLSVLGAVVGMIALSFASVPLYSLFCRVTGFGGTTMTAEKAPDQIIDRDLTIRFNTDTDSGLPWDFRSEKKYVKTKVGQQTLVVYKAHNQSRETSGGTAVFNVTPPKAGKYFRKIECFCFQEQILGPGKSVDMPVLFFVDPEFASDPDMEEVTTITLSYTFYPLDSAKLDAALEAFYNQSGSAKEAPSTLRN